jgi:2,3-bisphosphoglycerate-independent phosphoglycerate mutase
MTKEVKIKGIFVIIDGLGDLPNKQLNGKTPLEAAKTPRLDFLATRGELGYMYPVKMGYSPGSDESIVSIFGNNLKDSSRGQLEARGAGIKLRKGDLALRVNFGTIDSFDNGNVIDRRAGRNLSSKEAEQLANAINKIDFPIKFELVSTVQHRGALVFRGDFSDKIQGNDISYKKGISEEIQKITNCKAIGKDKKSVETAEILNEFMILSHEVLEKHPVNLERKRKGLLPANFLFFRTPGIEKPKLKQYRNWISTHSMPLEIGFSEFSGMTNYPFKYPPLKGIDAYANLWDGLKKSVKHSMRIIRKNLGKADYVYVHFKETDLPGHDNKPFEKKEMIEYLDKTFFKFLGKIAPPRNLKIIVTGDHSTPCKLKNHSADPVPVLFYNGSIPREKRFSEKDSKNGSLWKIIGKDLFKKTFYRK